MAPSGFRRKSLEDTIKNNKGKYILVVEGAVPTDKDGVYCMIGGKTAVSNLKRVAADAAAKVIVMGRVRVVWWSAKPRSPNRRAPRQFQN